MRHFFLPRTVTLGARGMVAATNARALIAPAGGALLCAPGHLGASSVAVDVAAITAGADQNLGAAARAEIGARGAMSLFGLSTEPWTNRATGEILRPHTCSRTVWGAAPIQTCQVRIGAVPVLNENRRLADARRSSV